MTFFCHPHLWWVDLTCGLSVQKTNKNTTNTTQREERQTNARGQREGELVQAIHGPSNKGKGGIGVHQERIHFVAQVCLTKGSDSRVGTRKNEMNRGHHRTTYTRWSQQGQSDGGIYQGVWIRPFLVVRECTGQNGVAICERGCSCEKVLLAENAACLY